MKIHSQRFQTDLEFDDSLVLNLPQGLLGFPESKRFCILELDVEDSPFKWLHDIDDTSVALLITDPYQFFLDYDPVISDRHLQDLNIKDSKSELLIFTIVKVSKGGREAFTNLRAPVAVNATTKKAKQIILDEERFAVKAALFREEEVTKMQEELKKNQAAG